MWSGLVRGSGPTALLAMATAGCGVELPPAPEQGPESTRPATLEVLAARHQVALLGGLLPEPLRVRVLDAQGAPVPGIEVVWRVEQGEGTLCLASGEQCGPRLFRVVTTAAGVAMVQFRPTGGGVARLSAVVTGLEQAPAIFTSETLGVLIRFGPMFDCTGDDDPVRFSGPDGLMPVTVDVGTLVVWEYAGWLHSSCTAQVVSHTTPPDGQPFDSGEMNPGEQFQFIPTVAGVWEFHDVVSGGGGRLNVVTPRSSPE